MTALYVRMIGFAVRRPRYVPALLGAAWAFRSRGWWRRPPFLPLPSPSYMRWRMDTAFGDPGHLPGDDELARFLKWASEMRSRM